MSKFKKSLKDNIIAPYNKYNLSQEKLGEILDTDKKKKTCTVSYRNVDGIKKVTPNVPVKDYLSSAIGGFPKPGDYVEIQEVGKSIRIVSIVKKDIVEAEQTTGDKYSNGSSYLGYMGI